MSILAFDTSLGECSVSLWHKGGIVTTLYEKERNRQTQALMPMIESVLEQANVALHEIQSLVTTSGPGSFTGIRIGLAVARSLALALKIPAIAVGTLELLAWQAAKTNPGTVVAVINAYRGEIYVQQFTCTPHPSKKEGTVMLLQPLTHVQAIPADQLDAYLPASPHIVIRDEEIKPDAAALAEYAALHSLSPSDYPPQPLYIRPPDAKLPAKPETV